MDHSAVSDIQSDMIIIAAVVRITKNIARLHIIEGNLNTVVAHIIGAMLELNAVLCLIDVFDKARTIESDSRIAATVLIRNTDEKTAIGCKVGTWIAGYIDRIKVTRIDPVCLDRKSVV